MRIITLLPSATEIIAALGLTDRLVGRSHACDWPIGLSHLPILTEPKIDPQASSAAIDRDVRALIEEGLSVYRVDAEQLKALRPDFIITQSQCELCAVSLSDVEQALSDWTGARPQLISLEPMCLADIGKTIAICATALGCVEAGNTLTAHMDNAFARLRDKTFPLADKRVCFLEWLAPFMSGGNWIAELIELGGGEPLIGEQGVHSSVIEWDALKRADPDVLIIAPCGFDIARTKEEMKTINTLPQWQALRAVQNRQVFIADGNYYFNRPGPRLVESAQIIAEILHPAHFPPQFAPHGWQKGAQGQGVHMADSG